MKFAGGIILLKQGAEMGRIARLCCTILSVSYVRICVCVWV